MIKKLTLPIQLILVILLVFTFGQYLSCETVKVFYTFSLIFKELLGAFLPFVIFFFIAAGILSFKKNAARVLAILLVSIVSSNLIVILSSFFIGRFLLPIITAGISANDLVILDTIKPFFKIAIPTIFRSEYSMLLAFFTGIFLSWSRLPKIDKFINNGKAIVELILNKVFIPIIPIYVVGFLLKVKFEGTFSILFESYGKAFALIVGMHLTYLSIAYLIASNFNIFRAIEYMKVSSAAYLTAFSTMSSTATIPVTLNCAIKNTGNRELASIATPIMANVHLLGDGITTPILSLVSMSIFLGAVPDLSTYLVFAFYFCLTMLATSGVPGGGIIVMIPILKSILGFTPDMISIITTLYLLQDSFGTAANVSGDGALMIIVDRFLKRFKII